ncbi:MAG: chemotaxis response regulator protein-glutamate methylesterase [Acidimicrobiaceae bacterium]|nr:chemotaxis response regulator protein-glutamate methylesterase [Acidimicrobiaceae bacterium]
MEQRSDVDGVPSNQPEEIDDRIRVLVVDDTVTIRRLVSNALDAEKDIVVVGTASNGRSALSKIEQLKPDVVTLDVEMPDMDGLQTLAALRDAGKSVPVIMFSTLTARGARATIEALALGAADYTTKPSSGNITESMMSISEDLVPKVRSLARRKPGTRPPRRFVPVAPTDDQDKVEAKPTSIFELRKRPIQLRRAPIVTNPVDIVAIGVSTGGPNALSVMLPLLPKSIEVPIVIVQHMPPMFTSLLAERLSPHCNIPVTEVDTPRPLTGGMIYLAPGGRHMVVERRGLTKWLNLNDDPPENSCRPAVDVLFRSVAQEFGPGVLGVILTGMGHDGLVGCESISHAGGRVIVQDEATSVVWGMPGSVASAGFAEAILPIEEIADEVAKRCAFRSPHRTARDKSQLT